MSECSDHTCQASSAPLDAGCNPTAISNRPERLCRTMRAYIGELAGTLSLDVLGYLETAHFGQEDGGNAFVLRCQSRWHIQSKAAAPIEC